MSEIEYVTTAVSQSSEISNNYDIIIIGTGAGGGTLAYALASTGKRILLLDRGEYIPREKTNWEPKAAYMDGRYRTSERWLDSTGNLFQPNQYRRVGGNTKIYGAALLRMRALDFNELQHYEGISPAWELEYSDFEPYYTQAEQLYKVHGQRGTDPTETLEPTAEYPFTPLPHSKRIQQVATQLQQAGLQPFALPMGLDYNAANKLRSPCILCDTCDGYACLLNAKADAQTCCVDPALQYPNVTLMTGVAVERLITSPNGREICAVEAIVNGQTERFTADIVVVSCGAINSAALLLQSANHLHPDGLANSSGQVGRNLMKHNTSKLYAIDPITPNDSVFQKTLAINDFYFGSDVDPYPLGHVHLMGKHKWQMMRPDFPQFVPQPVLEWLSQHSVDWWAQSEDLPDPNNRVLVKDGRTQVIYRPNNLQAHQRLKQRFKQTLRQIGFPLVLDVPMPLKVVNHQGGTCRFGSDPATSVLNLHCQTHDIDNLYVVDASFLPSVSAINPTLTIVANALRVADHLKQRLGCGSVEGLDRAYAASDAH
jgi:choline dehydrogenase-like flavoprotein